MIFSIIIPCYNVADYLPKCLDSVNAQTFSDYEVILVDDGSTDGITPGLCDRLSLAYGNRYKVTHQPNGGLGAARNTGMQHAQGEYLVFLDSDDYIAPGMLSGIAERISRTHADIYTFDFCTDIAGDTSAQYHDNLPADKAFTLKEYPRLMLAAPNAWNRAYKRSFFNASGIRYPGRVWFEDIRTTQKLFALAENVEYIPECWYYYVQRPGSITNSAGIARNSEIIDAFEDLLAFYRSKSLFDAYENELCRLAIDHLYIAASVRVLRQDPRHPLLKEFRCFMEKNFPSYRSNPYLNELPKMKHLAFTMLEKKQYSLLRMLFKVKG